jgi:AI-2 transport protein TqsA
MTDNQQVEAKELSLQLITLPILVIAAGTAFLYFAGPVLVPIVLAGTLTYLLLPAVNLIKKLKAPHWLAVLIVMLLVAGAFALLSYYIIGELSDLASTLPQYKDKILNAIQSWDVKIKELLDKLPSFLNTQGNLSVDTEKVQSVGGFVLRRVSSITSFLVSLVVIFSLTLFMLLESDILKKKFRQVFGGAHAAETENIIEEINAQIKGYIQVRFYVAVGLAIAVTIGLLILDVKYAYIWGPLAGILNIIPYIGSIISAFPPMIVAGIQHNSILQALYVGLFFLVVQTLEGSYITPKITTTSVDLNAVTALISLTYWGWIWGGIGIVLAVPITASIKVVCDHIGPLKPIGLLMGTERSQDISQAAIKRQPD